MIIKSLSRSNKSFKALYNYLTRDNEFNIDNFNLYSDPHNKKDTINEFLQNSNYLKNSRGKNYLYHEIISLNKNNLSQEQEERILKDLVQKYISLRAENHLVFSSCHNDKEHTHIHLMISSNEIMGNKRIRLSKKEFSNIQKELEIYSNTIYPELGLSKHYQKEKSLEKSKNKEQELKQRSKKQQTKKEQLKEILQDLFSKTQSTTYFKNHIKDIGLEFYIRGETIGVIYNNKKYRLKTLNLEHEYKLMLKSINTRDQRKERRANQKSYQQKSYQNDKATIEQRRDEMKKIRDSLDIEKELEKSR